MGWVTLLAIAGLLGAGVLLLEGASFPRGVESGVSLAAPGEPIVVDGGGVGRIRVGRELVSVNGVPFAFAASVKVVPSPLTTE